MTCEPSRCTLQQVPEHVKHLFEGCLKTTPGLRSVQPENLEEAFPLASSGPEGTRNPVSCVQGRGLPNWTTGPQRTLSGVRDLSPPPQPWEGRALPNELTPQQNLTGGLEPHLSKPFGLWWDRLLLFPCEPPQRPKRQRGFRVTSPSANREKTQRLHFKEPLMFLQMRACLVRRTTSHTSELKSGYSGT